MSDNSEPDPVQDEQVPVISDALVMFGLTGDLGRKKLFPALYELAAQGDLDIPVIGVGRSELTDDDLRESFRDAMSGHEPADGSEVDTAVVERVRLSYLAGDSTEPATFDRLLERLETAVGDVVAPLVYAALPPNLFGEVAAGMAASDFPSAARLVVEKPFGDGVETARSLWNEMTEHVPAEQLFIVDHFLAKSAVENMAVVRHVNPILSNCLDRRQVSLVEIVMSEAGDVDGRGSFYEGVGAVNDVVQSHLLQTMALLLMDVPAAGDVDDYRRERIALLAAVDPVDPALVTMGQYDGYRDHDEVADDSNVETYVSLELHADTDRWRGVPIRITTGKNLAETATTATFHLDGNASSASQSNRIRFEIKPSVALDIDIAVLDAESHELVGATLHACGPEDHGALGDYATMFADARNGVQRHFAHIDGVVEAWRILAPLADVDLERHIYQPGSDGPPS